MENPIFSVYYNTLGTEDGCLLIATGWCSQAGWVPELKVSDDGFSFRLILPVNETAQVQTPFGCSAEIPEASDIRSIFVKDQHGVHHIQVFAGEQSGGDSENKTGVWVKSK